MSGYTQLLDFDDIPASTPGGAQTANNAGNNNNINSKTSGTTSNGKTASPDPLAWGDDPSGGLDFQDYALSDSFGTGNIGSIGGGPSSSSAATGTRTFVAPQVGSNTAQFGTGAPQSNGTGGAQDGQSTSYSFWNIEYYSHYFNVNTNDVVERMTAAVIPTRDFVQIIGENPDLYGPFWISTTVILCLWVTSSMAGSIMAFLEGSTYKYDITLLSFALGTVYIYASVVPLILWGILKYFQAPGHLLHLLDVYGYGLLVWVPVSVLCIIPSELARWLIVGIAFGLSTFFNVKAIGPLAREAQDKRCTTIVYTITFLGHAALAMLFKFGFFHYVYKIEP